MDDKDHSGNSSETSSDDHGGAHNDGTGTSQEADIEDHSSGENGDDEVGKRNRSEALKVFGAQDFCWCWKLISINFRHKK